MKRNKYIRSISFLYKAFLEYIAHVSITSLWLNALIHKWRAVKIVNFQNIYFARNVVIDSVFSEFISIEEDAYICRGVKILSHFNPTDPLQFFLGKDSIVKPVIINKSAFINVKGIINTVVVVLIGKNAVVVEEEGNLKSNA